MLRFVSDIQTYDLRSNNLFRLPVTVSAFEQNSIMYNSVKIYNEMKRTNEMTESITDFKAKLMIYVKNNV